MRHKYSITLFTVLWVLPCVTSVTAAVTEEFLQMQAEALQKFWTLGEGAAQVIQQVSANGQRNLRPFIVKDKWEIQWDSKGPLLIVTLFHADGEMVGVAGSQQGDGKGSSYQAKGGDYYLQVTGTGEWTVTVVQLQ